ncbi:hypothetical protein HJC23_001063 [Cyclotella cryptica]|uniref:Uncharacterized protein n=1 Tax=Cyclotella cryptica TaxID=29204 RepID=A0ABD3QI58_9STRA|eukprot:CCRYP_005019-RA/>CCRYP_005019-RA protein AED:0.00 eAED:0.00 QI:242/-1/1/1/-1/1/1/148/458
MSPSLTNSGVARIGSTSTTQPLADILPWGLPISLSAPASSNHALLPSSRQRDDDKTPSALYTYNSRTVIITDSLSTDARFLLHTLALQFLSSKSSSTGTVSEDTSHNLTSASSDSALSGSVLWLSCGSPSVTENQIAIALRKAMQHGLGTCGFDSGGGGGGATSLGSVNVISIPSELADCALQSSEGVENFSHDSYLKRLHRRVVHWLHYRELLSNDQYTEMSELPADKTINNGPRLIIIDSATTLGTLVGDALTQVFVSSVAASLKGFSNRFRTTTIRESDKSEAITTITNLLAIRCTSPDDGGLLNIPDFGDLAESNGGHAHRRKGEKLRSEYSRSLRSWSGMGSKMFHLEEQSHLFSLQSNSTPPLLYKSGWYEFADAIVDVSPLESGYARDVLGRLSFTPTWNGMGWWGVSRSHSKSGNSNDHANRQGGQYASICVNYRCDDSGVNIMRLRSNT